MGGSLVSTMRVACACVGAGVLEGGRGAGGDVKGRWRTSVGFGARDALLGLRSVGWGFMLSS